MKAIEKAWNQAEQPKEFSIKIFEKEERNFFGMTTKPAKIGIFFTDKPALNEKPAVKPRPEIKECRPEPRDTTPKQAQQTQHVKTQPQPRPEQPIKTEQIRPEQPRTTQPKPKQPRTTPAQTAAINTPLNILRDNIA